MPELEDKLKREIGILLARCESINTDLMFKSAELSETREECERLRLAIKLHRAQEGHNKCWKNDFILHQSIESGIKSCPDPSKVSLPEFLLGCLHYAPSQFQDVSPEFEKMLEELRAKVRKYWLADLTSRFP